MKPGAVTGGSPPGGTVTGGTVTGGSVRLDKWLWFARFLKSRSLATALVASGRLRVNGEPTVKAHYAVKVGDVLTFPLGHHIRVIRVVAPGTRRGPAPEARGLYEDLDPPPERGAESPSPAGPVSPMQRDAGTGRPTKRDRRALDRVAGRDPPDDF